VVVVDNLISGWLPTCLLRRLSIGGRMLRGDLRPVERLWLGQGSRLSFWRSIFLRIWGLGRKWNSWTWSKGVRLLLSMLLRLRSFRGFVRTLMMRMTWFRSVWSLKVGLGRVSISICVFKRLEILILLCTNVVCLMTLEGLVLTITRPSMIRKEKVMDLGNRITWTKKRRKWRWEKPQEGGVELCFQKLFFLMFWKTVPRFRVWNGSESDLSLEA